jgi:bacillithiol biosynthesis deacetylase BshB1
MKLDILVIASHPDDAELSCGGTIAKYTAEGKQVGVVDLTRGEMSTRGTPVQRERESEAAGRILGLAVRENLGLRDAFFQNAWEEQQAIIQVIRKYRPDIVLTNALKDRHPDHGRAAQLVREASFMAGLKRIQTKVEDVEQEAFRPRQIFHFIQSQYLEPDLILDVSAYWEKKLESIRAYKSQFHNPSSKEPETYISSPEFLTFIVARGRALGQRIGVEYGEGFNTDHTVGVTDLFGIL